MTQHKRATGLEPYDVTEWRLSDSDPDYCEWCDEGSDVRDIGRHRHKFYVSRDGAASRTADDLAHTFLFDVAGLVPTYVVPADLAELEFVYPMGAWCDDPDMSQALHDEATGAAESALSDVGLYASWDDGYVIEELELWEWSDEERGRLQNIARRLFSDHYTGHSVRPDHRDECAGCVLSGWRGSKDVRAEWNVRSNGPNYAGWARFYVQARRLIRDEWAPAFCRELESPDNELYRIALARDIATFGPVRMESGATIGADGIVRSVAELKQ